MAVSLKHSKTAIGDDNPDRQVSVSHWNAEHTLTGTANTVLGFDTNGNATETTIVGSYAASVATRTALAALSSSQAAVNLRESGREGLFVWSSANNAANVTADPGQGIYVAPLTDTTGASGAWVRKFVGPKSAKWFGAVGDGTTDDAVALQRWLDSGGELILPATPSATWFRSSAKLYVRRNCHIVAETPYGNDSRIVASGYQYVPGSRIVFDAGVKGLDIQTSTALTDPAAVAAAGSGALTQEGAYNSLIEGIGIIGSGGAAANGVTVRTLCHFSNVRVAQFSGLGWDLNATLTVDGIAEYGNLSNSSLVDCSAETNGSHGLQLRGNDANTCKITGFNAQSNGGWGIYQNALIGSVFDKPHLATNTLGAIKTNSNALSVFILPYIETGTGSNIDVLDGNIMVGDYRSANVAGRLTAMYGNAAMQVEDVHAVGPSVPLTVNSTTSNLAKIAIQDNGTQRGYVGANGGAGIDVCLINADGNPAVNVYTVANLRRFEVIGGAWWSTAATRLGVTTGAQVFYDATAGGVFNGGGSSYDVSIQNKNGTTAIRVPTGTTNAEIVGSLTVGGVLAINSSGVIQAAATPAFTGDVTKSAGSLSTTIAANAVTFAKFVAATGAGVVGASGAGNFAQLGLAGGLAVSGGNLTAAGALTPTSVASTGAVTSSGTGGVGYATGAGGTVTQLTSRTTGVTLNKTCGAITLFTTTTTAGLINTFTVTNSTVAATDTINVSQKSGLVTGPYIAIVTAVAAGSFNLTIYTPNAVASDAPVFNFAVIKAVNA